MTPRQDPRWHFLLLPISSILLIVSVGCTNKDARLLEAQDQNRQLSQQLRQSQQTIEAKQDQISRQSEQIENLTDLGPKRMDVLFTVDRIKLGRYSGGTSLDDMPGDDGVKVYIIPQDDAGRTVTAAGSIEVNVFDLAEKDAPLLMSYSFSAEKVRKHWHSGGLANHYAITCPWKDALPSGNEITIRVKFVDYLTGQTFTATKQCQIRPPTVD